MGGPVLSPPHRLLGDQRARFAVRDGASKCLTNCHECRLNGRDNVACGFGRPKITTMSDLEHSTRCLSTVSIVEVIRRSTQGVTLPFLCRGDDGFLYYVKGKSAGRRSLICEWIAGLLGKQIGLPIPDFKQAVITTEFVSRSARNDIGDLGAGIGFASQIVNDADELTYLYIAQIDDALRAEVLLFDWWTSNGDRTLTEHGGNPNILWVHRDHKPYVIDHNIAFDETARSDFWTHHIFASSRSSWTLAFRNTTEHRMRTALSKLDVWWRAMPAEWTEMPTGITLESVKTLLWRFETDSAKFWTVL